MLRFPLSLKGLRDSRILPMSSKGVASKGGCELVPADVHGLWPWLSIVAVPPAEACGDPCDEGERSGRVRILLLGGCAFEFARQPFERDSEVIVDDIARRCHPNHPTGRCQRWQPAPCERCRRRRLRCRAQTAVAQTRRRNRQAEESSPARIARLRRMDRRTPRRVELLLWKARAKDHARRLEPTRNHPCCLRPCYSWAKSVNPVAPKGRGWRAQRAGRGVNRAEYHLKHALGILRASS